jgi:hypothetical protein
VASLRHYSGSCLQKLRRTTNIIRPTSQLRSEPNNIQIKNGVFWDVTPCCSLRTDVSEELSASFIRVTRTGELGTLAATSNRRTQRASVASCS